jgi:hypothetical protein
MAILGLRTSTSPALPAVNVNLADTPIEDPLEPVALGRTVVLVMRLDAPDFGVLVAITLYASTPIRSNSLCDNQKEKAALTIRAAIPTRNTIQVTTW